MLAEELQRPQNRLREVPSQPLPQTAQPKTSDAAQAAGLAMLLLGLKALSQRFVVALAALRGLILAGTAFWLALLVLPNPNTYQLVGLGIYCIFVVIFEFWTRRNE